MKTNHPNSKPDQLNQQIGQLFSQSLKISSPIQMLHIIREKINYRDYQPFDKEDILNELGQLQKIMAQIHNNMLQIDEILKQP
jgi:hypothetical protein